MDLELRFSLETGLFFAGGGANCIAVQLYKNSDFNTMTQTWPTNTENLIVTKFVREHILIPGGQKIHHSLKWPSFAISVMKDMLAQLLTEWKRRLLNSHLKTRVGHLHQMPENN